MWGATNNHQNRSSYSLIVAPEIRLNFINSSWSIPSSLNLGNSMGLKNPIWQWHSSTRKHQKGSSKPKGIPWRMCQLEQLSQRKSYRRIMISLWFRNSPWVVALYPITTKWSTMIPKWKRECFKSSCTVNASTMWIGLDLSKCQAFFSMLRNVSNSVLMF